ncbi:MAG: hypothetical protein WAV89_03645 [Ignavibacteriaceae bacterium]
MKKILFLVLISFPLFAQYNDYPRPDEGYLSGGLGLNWIDGKPYYRIGFRPEISFANFGVGLDLNLDFDSDGNLRKENFNEFTDYLSIIRYVRYGLKNDPVFIKLGALDYYTLGHGTIMHQYNNSPTYDARRIGLVADIDFGKFGFESIYGSFAQSGVFGMRAYARPLQYTEAGHIPIIGNLEFGASYVTDFNEYARVDSGYFDQTGKFKVVKDGGALTVLGIEVGLPLIKSSVTTITLYADYNKIIDFGSGVATGIKFDFAGLGLISASAKLERRFNNGKYLPSYFNSFYEIERFKSDSAAGTYTSKSLQLANITENANGFYGDLFIRVLNLFDIYGSYQRLDKNPKSGILNLRTAIEPEEAPFVLRAGYDKINIIDEKDLFKLDDRSYLFTEVGYKPMPYILVSIVYNWTFAPVRDSDDNIVGYKPQKRIEPRVSFIYPFKF